MIIVISGTREGREISSLLCARGYEVLAVTATENGSRIVVSNASMEVVEKHPVKDGLEPLLKNKAVRILIDASHPFPGGLSGLTKELCRTSGIPYIRFIREEVDLPESPLLFPVYSWEEAAQKAAEFGNTIFLTTGSYNLELFLKHPSMTGKRIVVRVLPDHRVIEAVQSLGIIPRDIVAMQGPFSKDMNRITFKMYNASVIVTKDSGRVGGTDSKISAALGLKIPVVIIKRSKLLEKDGDTVLTYEQVLEKVAFLLKTP
ncbi:MAG: precorrin-6A reductase [Eubacteriales bacterium]